MAAAVATPEAPGALVTTEQGTDGIRSFKVLVVGAPSVGKTSIIKRFLTNEYDRDEPATTSVQVAVKLTLDSPMCVVEAWDIPAYNDNDSALDTYTRNIDGVAIVTDVCRPSTFTAVPVWRELVAQYCHHHRKQRGGRHNSDADSGGGGGGVGAPENWQVAPLSIPVIIVANKCNRAESFMSADELRDTVKYRRLHAGFLVSAKSNDQIDAAFDFLVDQMHRTNDDDDEDGGNDGDDGDGGGGDSDER